jgi:hypothetical protein
VIMPDGQMSQIAVTVLFALFLWWRRSARS